MALYLRSESASAFAERRPFSWRAFLRHTADTARGWLTRRRQRQELLDYMIIDYRAAADMGVSTNDARDWAQRPFWRI